MESWVTGPSDTGEDLHGWARDLFPITRSLTGDGVRQTLRYLAHLLPGLIVHEVPSGTEVFDWAVPDEWNLRSAHLSHPDGRRIVDTDDSNLHVVGYSEPVHARLTRAELEPHLHSIPELPDAIPYVTSYYKRTWGFCLTQRQRDALGDGPFDVHIDSDLGPGSLTYGELIIPGASTDEILLSTYVCHPSLANNELSGPVVTTALARWISSHAERHYTYRIVFIPETIGSITYLARNLDHLKEHVRAGWVLTCIGDEGGYSYVPSRYCNSMADRISLRAVADLGLDCHTYTFLDRGSDERQYCSPGVDLPVASLMRTKYGQFEQYHTSLDDLDFVTPVGLQGGLDMMAEVIRILESELRYRASLPCEPQMGKRGLYPTTSTRSSGGSARNLMNVLAYSDGTNDARDIAEVCGIGVAEVREAQRLLIEAGLLST